MCTNPKTIKVPTSPAEYALSHNPYKVVTVPCGKCYECLSVRQNQLSVRCANEAMFKGSCHFLTLTYSEDNVPLSISPWKLDKSTGEYSQLDVAEPLTDAQDFRYRSCVLKDSYVNGQARIYEHMFCDLGDSLLMLRVTPSLRYDDVRLWLKLSRVRYEREFGHKMSDFTYCIVGEYGHHNTCRPHYHCLFFGATRKEVQYLANLWSSREGKNFGYSYLSNEIPCTDFGKVSSYLGKYCAKGDFDLDSVRQGLTYKSRMCTSKYLGSHISEASLYSYRALDYMVYDVNQSSFPEELLSVIRERLYIKLPGLGDFKFKLPKCILNTIFNNKWKNGVFQKSNLQIAYSNFVRNRISEENEGEFEQFISNFLPEDLSLAVSQFENNRLVILQAREKNRKESIRKKLKRSKF